MPGPAGSVDRRRMPRAKRGRESGAGRVQSLGIRPRQAVGVRIPLTVLRAGCEGQPEAPPRPVVARAGAAAKDRSGSGWGPGVLSVFKTVVPAPTRRGGGL